MQNNTNKIKFIARKIVTQENIIECVQQLIDVFGNAKNGTINENTVYICGIEIKGKVGK